MKLKTLRLNRHEEKRLQNGHLWIFSNEVNNKETPLKQFLPGEQVRVETALGKFLAMAYVNPQSLICARVFSRTPRALDQDLLLHRMKQALKLRDTLFDAPYYRLVYGESDLLPGLVVDRFGPHLSVQLNSAGMEVLKSEIIETLCRLLHPESILFRNDSSMRRLEGLAQQVETGYGECPREVELEENGVRLLAPLLDGQKTGWFFDQRPNRAVLRRHVRNKRVLDVFSYVGGFAVQAAAFGARAVMAVDASRFALEMAERNAALNGVGDKFSCAEGDAFEVLRTLRQEGGKFDVIVVDPPAFIKRKKDHRQGLRAYQRINELAMRLLNDDGLLLAASCSMHLQSHELMEVLRNTGRRVDRHVQVLYSGMQGPDHPVHPAIPETCYLKAFLARVTRE